MATNNLNLAICTPKISSLYIPEFSFASIVASERAQIIRGPSSSNSRPWTCRAKPMLSTRAEQSRRRSESCICKSWFGETKETKPVVEEGGEAASEEEEKRETKTKYSKLVLSLAVDAVSFLVHSSVLDFDFAWAPLAAIIVQRMFRAPLLTAVGFVEEAIPGINFVPTATLGWVVESSPQLEFVSKLPFMGGLGKGAKNKDSPWWWPL